MIKRMLGAFLGGTTRGGHHAFDCRAFSPITPPNFGSGGGSCLPLIVVVALGDPGSPVICAACICDTWVLLPVVWFCRNRRSIWAGMADTILSNTTAARATAIDVQWFRLQ